MIRWDRALEAVLLAVSLAAPLAFFANGYDAALVKVLLAQVAAALAAACWAGRAVSAGRLELPEGRLLPALAAAAWLVWQPGPAPILFLAALLGDLAGGFSRRHAAAAAVAASVLVLAEQGGFSLMPDAHAFGVFLAVALPLALHVRREPGEPRGMAELALFAASLAYAGLVSSGSPAALAAWAAAASVLALGRGWRGVLALASVPVALLLAPVSEAQWLLIDPAWRPGALVALLAAAFCARSGHWAQAAASAAVGAAGLVSSYDAGALGWIAAGAGAARAASEGATRVIPIPYSPLARRYAYLPLLILTVFSLKTPTLLFVSDVRYNEALALSASDPERSLGLLAKVWAGSPLAAHAAMTEAGLHRRLGRTEQAIEAYARAAALAPDDARLFRSLGILEAEAGRWESARGLLADAAKLEPRDERTWTLLVEANKKLGDKEGTLEAARGLVRCAPREPKSWYALSEAYQETKQYARSRLARAEGAGAVRLAKRRR